jgi:DNA-binding CsgD family transcriptional regulator/PAS domain-containing protein
MTITTERLDTLIARIYEAALDPERWESFMLDAADTLDAAQSTLVLYDHADPEHAVVRTTRFDPHIERIFVERREAEDEWALRLLAKPPGSVQRGSDLVSLPEWRRTAIYADVCRPMDAEYMLGGIIERKPELTAGFSVLRGKKKGDFTAQEMAVVESLMEHLRRAFDIHTRFAAARFRAATLEGALNTVSDAVFTVDADLNVVSTNRAAEGLLSRADGIVVRCGKLVFGDDTAQRLLESAIGNRSARTKALRYGFMSRSCSGRAPHHVRVHPASIDREETPQLNRRYSFVVILNAAANRSPSPEFLRRYVGVTMAEARLISQLLAGRSLAEAAGELDLSIHTVRGQLKSVFQKLGVHSQSQLILYFSRLIT